MSRPASRPGPAASAPPRSAPRAASRGEVLFLGLAAAASVAGTAFWYAATIRGQGDSLLTARPLFVVSSLTAVALMAIAGTVVERPPATAALWAATGALMMLGLIGLFSIGLFLMLAGGLAALAAVGSGRRTGLRWAACLAAVLLGVAVAAGSFLAMASVD